MTSKPNHFPFTKMVVVFSIVETLIECPKGETSTLHEHFTNTHSDMVHEIRPTEYNNALQRCKY